MCYGKFGKFMVINKIMVLINSRIKKLLELKAYSQKMEFIAMLGKCEYHEL